MINYCSFVDLLHSLLHWCLSLILFLWYILHKLTVLYSPSFPMVKRFFKKSLSFFFVLFCICNSLTLLSLHLLYPSCLLAPQSLASFLFLIFLKTNVGFVCFVLTASFSSDFLWVLWFTINEVFFNPLCFSPLETTTLFKRLPVFAFLTVPFLYSNFL